ncbi:uncharacterized protein LOC135351023 isoform X2 [Halichondria panicea]|uniref:uncharacterized protein LOC135351023 isoform X2 n=1 Tax=Halichondria panicea TaxID=6063 RepID=UPI00312B2EB7
MAASNRLIDGLLVDIGDTLTVAKFTELISLYDVPVPDGITDHFRVLKYLKDNGKLELEELANNLEDIRCEDESQKVREFTDFKATIRQRKNSAAYVGIRGVAGEIQPEEASPGVRKKGTNDQDDPYTADEVVEEIPCDAEPYNEDDMKYMQEAIDLCKESKDKKTKVGSVLVHTQNGVIGRGYNRMPLCRGQELDFPWTSDEAKSSLDKKYLYVVHSAIAAIIDATERWTKDGISGSTLYTTLFPANRDAQINHSQKHQSVL